MATILITGANRGIGRALWERKSDAIGTSRKGGVQYKTLDVCDPASLAALAKTLDGRPIDLLICNAGVYLDKGEVLETGYAPDLWAQTFAANVTGVFLTVQSLLPHLALSGAPRIAIISSQIARTSSVISVTGSAF